MSTDTAPLELERIPPRPVFCAVWIGDSIGFLLDWIYDFSLYCLRVLLGFGRQGTGDERMKNGSMDA